MTSHSSPSPSPERVRRKDVITVTSADLSVELTAASSGGQLMSGRVDNYDVVSPIDRPTGVVTDTREVEPNEYEEGEVVPGGSWWSVDTKATRKAAGDASPRPVHGPQRQPWTHWIEHVRTLTSVILKHEPAERDAAWFREGEAYEFVREFTAESGQGNQPGTLFIGTTVIARGDRPYNLPDMVEHFYAHGGGDTAVLLDEQGRPVAPRNLADSRPADKRNNDIDTRVRGDFSGTPGRLVFMPDGERGHVVVLEAAVTLPDETVVPVKEWCVYRQKYADAWTGLEPVVPHIVLQQNDQIKLEMRVRTFASLGEYHAYLPTMTA